ncbi:MAG: glycosyltransferase family 2 protein [Sphingomicrobium sp.]
MPVHNALPHLDAAVESILRQSFANFEFIILDDASTDGSTERLREWASKDSRIRLLEVTKNLGPALSSEYVACAASTPIVARMDADDVSYPERIEEQAHSGSLPSATTTRTDRLTGRSSRDQVARPRA